MFRLIRPDSIGSSTTAGLGPLVDWYYGSLSTKGTWQLVFQGGRLTAKHRYS